MPHARKGTPTIDEKPFDLDDLYRAYSDRVARWAAALGGPGIEAADIVQEVFVTAFRRLASFRGDSAVTSWLYAITRNAVRDQRKRAAGRRRRETAAEEIAEELVAKTPTPLEQVERLRAARVIYRVLDELKEKYREVLVLYEIEGLSGEEIARLTNGKIATVWVRLHRAREQFAKQLARLFPEEAR